MSARVGLGPSAPSQPLHPILRSPALVPVPHRVSSLSSGPSSSSQSSDSHTPTTPSSHASTVKPLRRPVPKFLRQQSVSRFSGHHSAILGAVEVHQRALYFLWPENPIRRVCIELANAPWYTNFNLMLILINCGTLMVESGRTLGSAYNFSDLNSTLNCIDAMFASFFTLELIVKVIAGGWLFAGPSSYLRSSWNILDGIVVLFALLNFIPSMQNFTYIRALRLIRPLKAASNIPGLRVMMNAMLAATMTLGNVFLFVFLLLFTFALFGLQIYRDVFRNRCIPLDTGLISQPLAYGFAGCSTSIWPWAYVGPYLCPNGQFCADSGVNPYADTMGYDNIIKGWVMSLIVMSGEGWSDIMYMGEDSVSSMSWAYFILLTCLSNYLGGELVVAVMSVKFEDAKVEEQEKMKEEEEQKMAVRAAQKKIREFKKTQKRMAKAKKKTILKSSNDANAKQSQESPAAANQLEDDVLAGSVFAMGILETAQVMQLAAVIKSQNRQKAFEKAQAKKAQGTPRIESGAHPFGAVGGEAGSGLKARAETFFSESSTATPKADKSARIRTALQPSRRDSVQPLQDRPTSPNTATSDDPNPPERVDSGRRGGLKERSHTLSQLMSTTIATSSSDLTSSSILISRLNSTFHTAASRWSMHSQMDIPFPSTPPSSSSRAAAVWYQVRLVCHRLIFSSASFWLFSSVTVLNCAVLASDHWGISPEFSAVLNGFNVAFFVCFAVELMMRLIAIEWAYFRYGYFLFDLVIVIVALVDTVLSESSSVLSALKAFRVFRMFTVFRHWKSMQRIMKQAHSSLEDLFYFSLVLFLFVFIFAQMGVQIAKDREDFPQPEGPARDNWDSIGWAMIVVFQVSTPENWNQVLYDMVQGVGWGGGFFVILNLLIGHYIIESLFVVVMFSHFGTDGEEDQDQAAVTVVEAHSQNAVVPIDHVQAMLQRAGVSDEHSSGQRNEVTKGGAGELNRLLSFDSPILSRPATFFSQKLTARTPKRAGSTRGEDCRVDGWMDEEKTPIASRRPLALTTDTEPGGGSHGAEQRPETPRGLRLIQGQLDDRKDLSSDEERSKGLDSPPLSPVQRGRPAGMLPPLAGSGQAAVIPSVISDPSGFLTGSAPVNVAGRSFLSRLARNIEKSKAKKAEKDRKEEVEKLIGRSHSATRQISVVRSDGDHSARGSRGNAVGDPGVDSKRGSFSAKEAASGGTTERRTEMEQRAQSMSADAAENDDEYMQRLKVQFDLQGKAKEGEANEAKQEMTETQVESFTLSAEDKDATTSSSSPDSREEQTEATVAPQPPMEQAAAVPVPVLSWTTAGPSIKVLPPLTIVPNLPPPSPGPATATTSLPTAPPTPGPLADAQPTAPAPSFPAVVELKLPLLSVSTAPANSVAAASALSPPPAVRLTSTPISTKTQSMSFMQPVYDAHIAIPRRRFVIPHHFPPGQPWYRVDPPEPFTDDSFYLFAPDNQIRLALTRVIHSDAWSLGVLWLIFVSCVLLALDSPGLDPNSTEGLVIYYLDLATTILYCVEMGCRFIVFGVIVGERSCLRNGWNVMEFGIVLVSVASTIVPSVNGLKALRALRPLRILSRLPGAKLVVSSLGKSMLNIANVLVVAFLLLLCLAIVAVALFKGRLQQCLQPPDGVPIAVDEPECAVSGGVWTNPIWTGNYDDVSAALLVLFEICTEENWPGTMYTAVDATEPGLQPNINNNQWYGLYFVVAIVIGSLFVKTLFTATILDGYSLNYAEITGAGGGTTPLQRQWIDFYKLTIDMPPPLSKPRPNQKWVHRWDLKVRRFFFDTAKSQAFEYFFLGIILLNVIALSMSFSYQPAWYGNMLTIINSICTWLFVCEIIILWLGPGIRDYFRSRFSQFDLVIVILTAYEFFYEQNLVSFQIGFNPSIFRVIRMVRIFKLFQKFPRLVQLGQTVWFSLPALYNVSLLMVLEYFIFSVLGMSLFGKVKHGYFMTRHGNYENFPSAMVTLFREMTGENWNGIMRDCMVQPPFCDPDIGECGNTILSPLFHVGFQVMSAMLVMDLIVAIILNQFENQLEKEKRMDSAIMTGADMRTFGEHWAHFSRGKWTMPVSKLPAFLRYLPPPLGPQKGSQLYGVDMAHFLDELKIPSDNQNVHYLDVIHQLGYRAFQKKFPDIAKMEDDEEKSIAHLLPDDDDVHDLSLSSLHLPYTTAGIRLANEDLSLIRRQAQRQFPALGKQLGWDSLAGQVHRVVICQKMLRGVFDRKRLRTKLVKPLLMEVREDDRTGVEEAAALHARRRTSDFDSKAVDHRNSVLIGSSALSAASGASRASWASAGLSPRSMGSMSVQGRLLPSPSSANGRKYSVVAEFMAMRALSKKSGGTFNSSMSNLVSSSAPSAGHVGLTDSDKRAPSGGETPISAGHSMTLPLLVKAVSLPLARTTEAEREEDHEDAGDATPSPDGKPEHSQDDHTPPQP